MRRRSVFGLTLALGVVAGLHGSAEAGKPAGFLAEVDWDQADPRFGGISAISVTDGGNSFTAVSDRGSVLQGRLLRDGTGRLTGVAGGAPVVLLRPDGTPLPRSMADSEGLALDGKGGFYISFEGPARVRHYARPGAPAENLDRPRAFDAMIENASLESLCRGPDGALYTLPEDSGSHASPFPLFRWRAGQWDRFGTIARSDEFRAVDCAIGPDGRFYLLQRAFHGLGGFASRLVRFDFTANGLTGRQVLFQSETGTFDDLEGLSVWRDAAGRLRATMVSDDNFSAFFVTEVVEFALPE